MNGALQIFFLARRLIHEGKAHRVMRIGDRESRFAMKEMSRRWKKCFEKNHRRDRDRAEKFVPVVKSFRCASEWAGEKCLMIARKFAVAIEPRDEVSQNIF